jgi:hypothetical protein
MVVEIGGPPGETNFPAKGTPLLAMLPGITRKSGADSNFSLYALRRATAAGSLDLEVVVVVFEDIAGGRTVCWECAVG